MLRTGTDCFSDCTRLSVSRSQTILRCALRWITLMSAGTSPSMPSCSADPSPWRRLTKSASREAHSTRSSNDIITSLSSGHLAHLVATSTGYITSSQWQAHAYEPWTTAFDHWDPNRVWSGGDDCVLKAWDIRVPEIPAGSCKAFEAGVTTVTSSPHTEHLLAVGR